MSESKRIVRVGSRKSQLAMVQTENVIEKLKDKHPHIGFEIVGLSTVGDQVLDKSLAQIGQTSLFLKELEVALLDKRVDIVVHSLKDVPTDLPAGLVIGAVCEREVCGDALVVKKGSEATSLDTLPEGSVVGTSSARRTAQLARSFPHLKIVDVRGNLNTRLSKLDEEGGPYDALVLAAAGLVRLGWHDRITQVLDSGEVMYAVGQGAIGVECRMEDQEILQLLSHLTHHDTLLACIAERSFLHKLQGGCSLPVSVLSSLKDKQLSLKGGVLSVDGKKELQASLKCDLHASKHVCPKDSHLITSVFIENPALEEGLQAEKLGNDLAEMLLKDGASELLKEARSVSDKVAAVELKD